METKNKTKFSLRPIIGITIISLLICGLFYPFLMTGIGQVFFPSQSNGEIAKLNGQAIGSDLIAQNFTLPIFFHSRNETLMQSASGVDPDITMQDATSQIPSVSNATGISIEELTKIVNENQEGTLWIFGSPYVNVLKLNTALIEKYPTVYIAITG